MKKQINLLSFLMILLIIFMCGCTVKPNEPDDKPPINNNQNNNENNNEPNDNDLNLLDKINCGAQNIDERFVHSAIDTSVYFNNLPLELYDYYIKDDNDYKDKVNNIKINASFCPEPAFKIILYYKTTANQLKSIFKDGTDSDRVFKENMCYFSPEILCSGNDVLISNYYSDIRKRVCYYNEKYHDFTFLANKILDTSSGDFAKDPKYNEWYESIKTHAEFNIIGFVKYFNISKENFIKYANEANIDIDADIVYSNDKKLIYNYFKNTQVDCPDYDSTYYTIAPQLMEYVGYASIDDYITGTPTISQLDELYKKNMKRVEWMNKYKGDWSQINIVNFIKGHNISKEQFEKIMKNDILGYNTDVLFSGDQAKIDEVYKLK